MYLTSVSQILLLALLSALTTAENNEVFFQKTKLKEKSVLDTLYDMNIKEIDQNNANVERSHDPIINKMLAKNRENLMYSQINEIDHGQGDMQNNFGMGNYVKNLQENSWREVKNIANQFLDSFTNDESINGYADKRIINIIQKFLNLGEKVNFLQTFGKEINPKLLEFILEKFSPYFDENSTLGYVTSIFKGNFITEKYAHIINKIIIKIMKYAAKYLLSIQKSYVPESEILGYYQTLLHSNPLAAQGLRFILDLELPPSMLLQQKRSADPFANEFARDGYGGYPSQDTYGGGGGYSGGGGHGGGYGGGGGGYSTGVMLDPYLILGGIGAASLLAFIAYRIIVTTMKRKRRDSDEFSMFFIDESDIPNIVNHIYKMIEGAEIKYEMGNEIDDSETVATKLVETINNLWTEHQAAEKGCVRCKLFDYVKQYLRTDVNYLNSLIAASLAQLLGGKESGQMLDIVMDEVTTKNNVISCQRKRDTCHIVKGVQPIESKKAL